jgi:hypothetical protein
MENNKKLFNIMRMVFLTAFIFDILLGFFLIIFAKDIQIFLEIGIREEPAFIRLIGLFPIFVGYLYYLMFRDQKKYAVLIKVTLLERITFPIILAFEILSLIKPPFGIFKYFEIITIIITTIYAIFLGVMQAYYLKKTGENIFEF